MGNCFNISNIPVASPLETDNIITVIGIPYIENDCVILEPSAPPIELINVNMCNNISSSRSFIRKPNLRQTVPIRPTKKNEEPNLRRFARIAAKRK